MQPTQRKSAHMELLIVEAGVLVLVAGGFFYGWAEPLDPLRMGSDVHGDTGVWLTVLGCLTVGLTTGISETFLAAGLFFPAGMLLAWALFDGGRLYRAFLRYLWD